MINVVFNIDENYKSQCKTVIRSILANTKSKVTFYVIGVKDLETSDINADIKCFDKPDLSIIKVPIRMTHITIASVYRLFLPQILNIDKCIYLDCDLIVLKDIKDLWDYDIEYIGAVQDPMFIKQAKKNNLHHCYVNSGVMVLNLKNLRKLNYFERIAETQTGKYNLSLLDQDVINIAFGDEIEHISEEWNVYSKIYSQTTKEMLKARENPSIIHWCGAKKPFNSDVWNGDKWHEYEVK